MADIEIDQEATLDSDAKSDDFGGEDELDSEPLASPLDEECADDLLQPIERIEKYFNSEELFDREIAVRDITGASGMVYDIEALEKLCDYVVYLSSDTDAGIRMSVVMQLLNLVKRTEDITMHPSDREEIQQRLLNIAVAYLTDTNYQVRRGSHLCLASTLEENEQNEVIVRHICEAVALLFGNDSSYEYRLDGLVILSRICRSLKTEVLVREFVPFFEYLASDNMFHVRKAFGMCCKELSPAMSLEENEVYILPLFLNLCQDVAWGVRKACADVFMDIAASCSAATRSDKLTKAFTRLLDDTSRWVKKAAYTSLGPFITTFHVEKTAEQLEMEQQQQQDVTECHGEVDQFNCSSEDDCLNTARFIDGTPPFHYQQIAASSSPKEPVAGGPLSLGAEWESERGGGVTWIEKQLEVLTVSSDSSSSSSSNGTSGEAGYSDLDYWRQPIPEVSIDLLDLVDDDETISGGGGGGVTIVAGGVTVVAGGVTVVAGGVTVAAGGGGVGEGKCTTLKERGSNHQNTSGGLKEGEEEQRETGRTELQTRAEDNESTEEDRLNLSAEDEAVVSESGSREALDALTKQLSMDEMAMGEEQVMVHFEEHESDSKVDAPLRDDGRQDMVLMSENFSSELLNSPAGPSELMQSGSDMDLTGINHTPAAASELMQSGSDMDLTGINHSQLTVPLEVVPAELVDFFFSMNDQVKIQQVDSELPFLCAYSFPGVAVTLGPAYWPQLKPLFENLSQHMHWKIRRALSFCLHDLAQLVGPEKTVTDILPVFEDFLKDVEDVRIGILSSLSDLFKTLPSSKQVEYLPLIKEFLDDHNDRNWRYRLKLAEQLCTMCAFFSPEVISDFITPLALELARDKVAELRFAAADLLCIILKRLSDNQWAECTGLLDTLRQVFVANGRTTWKHRLMFIQLTEKMLETQCLEWECVERECVPQMIELHSDQVPNVRLAVAGLSKRILADDSLDKSLDLKEKLSSTLEALKEDSDNDVRCMAGGDPLPRTLVRDDSSGSEEPWFQSGEIDDGSLVSAVPSTTLLTQTDQEGEGEGEGEEEDQDQANGRGILLAEDLEDSGGLDDNVFEPREHASNDHTSTSAATPSLSNSNSDANPLTSESKCLKSEVGTVHFNHTNNVDPTTTSNCDSNIMVTVVNDNHDHTSQSVQGKVDGGIGNNVAAVSVLLQGPEDSEC